MYVHCMCEVTVDLQKQTSCAVTNDHCELALALALPG